MHHSRPHHKQISLLKLAFGGMFVCCLGTMLFYSNTPIRVAVPSGDGRIVTEKETSHVNPAAAEVPLEFSGEITVSKGETQDKGPQPPTHDGWMPSHICGNWVEEYAQLHKRILSGKLNPGDGNKVIVYQCKGGCGGLGDRFMGSVTTSLLALLLGRAYLIEWNTPAPISHFLSSRYIDWEYSEGRLPKGITKGTYSWIDGKADKLTNTFQKSDLEKILPHRVSFISNNKSLFNYIFGNPLYKERLLGLGFTNSSVAYGCIHRFLYQPKPHLQQVIQKYVDLFASSYTIGIHVRTGSGNGWSDPKRCHLELVPNFWECVSNITQTLGRPQEQVHIFVSSDSNVVLEMAKEQYGDRLITVQEGEIVHTDRSGKKAGSDTAMIRTLADHFLLSEANDLIFGYSGFSFWAQRRSLKPAYFIGCRPFDLPARNENLCNSREVLFSGPCGGTFGRGYSWW